MVSDWSFSGNAYDEMQFTKLESVNKFCDQISSMFVLNVKQELPCPPEWLCFNKCHRLLQVMKTVHKLWLFMCSWMLRNLLRTGDPDEGGCPCLKVS
ncbi:hypothetical protein OPV22_028366 [Ensete ventricosum]|uniref:Uncharacterized protein n=1 Tax=Ensete ventricosum TaxID=4639 RepID=A0AAV8Q3G9_ENSVE|nr:hypothetical protein OPV22_028366 [Ensete ventricosum]